MDSITEWLTSETAIKKSKKGYAHFDQRTDISKCRLYISNPNSVAKHGFYPFIHYEKIIKKYQTKLKKNTGSCLQYLQQYHFCFIC